MEPSLTRSEFAVPIEERWFEDFVPGTVYEFGHMEVTEAEISILPAGSIRSRCMSMRRRQSSARLRG